MSLNPEEQYTNVRFESVSFKQMKKEIKHDLRMNKIGSVTKPDQPTIMFIQEDGEWTRKEFLMRTEKAREEGRKVLDLLPSIEERHRRLLRKNFNQSLNKERVSSFNMGVLTFSESMREHFEKDPERVLELGRKTIERICRKEGVKLHYISFHADEDGIPHFHFFTDNFKENGRTANPKRNKQLGERLQDMGAHFFKELGFRRGLSKEITKGRHMTIQEYKAAQDALKENAALKEENERLKKEVEETGAIHGELTNLMFDIVENFLEIGLNYKGKDAKELMELWTRYLEQGQMDKFDKLADKIFKLMEKKGFNLDITQRVRLNELRKDAIEGKKRLSEEKKKGGDNYK